DFNTEFYFDKEDSKLICEIKYIYTNGEDNNPIEHEGYIIRNFKKEYDVEDKLYSYNFYNRKDKYVLNVDDWIEFEFFRDKINELKEIGDVYYSDRLKNIKIYKNVNIKANFSLLNQNYLDFDFSIEDIDKDEYKDILKAFKSKRKFFKLKNDSFLDLQDEKLNKFFALVDDIKDKNMLKDDEATYRLGMSNSLYLNELLEDEDLGFIKGVDEIKERSEKFKSMSDLEVTVPQTLNATLREYQVRGLQWFKTMSYFDFGGILADEMGLGKTIQTITFLLSEKGKKSIIITPTSLIYNWKNEFETFAPSLNVVVLHGNKNERTSLYKQIDKADVILTTYGVLKNDFEDYGNKMFDYCIIDEAQNIKNPYSQSSEVVKNIQARVKFALTGTPIENNLLELWSIFDFIMPGYLYSKNRFKEEFIKSSDNYEELRKQIQPFILRRLKKDVLTQLPDKIETKFFVEMTTEQKKAYQTYAENIIEKMKNSDLKKDKITILSYLTTLRQLCLDPSIKVDDYTGGSGKIEVLKELVHENIQGNHKMLVFSQFTSVLKNIGKEFEKENIKYFYLDGTTNAKDRIGLVNEFNQSKDTSVFLISLKAGGTGLNLTGADVVVHFDPWWNPAIENQATDRAHRYGQENVVEVIKLIAKGTIEEKIVKLQEVKKELIDRVISE
ncbi:MAG: DEAD/DEAH box helicase, partial [Paraclostridium sp.]